MSHLLTNCDALPILSESAEEARSSAGPLGAPSQARRVVFAIVISGFVALSVIGVAMARDYHSNPWLLSWIPPTCCVTNDCCWEISEREVKPMPDDQWEVVSTGQVRKRTDYSPDGKFYRCACDYDQADRHWVRHQGANTRCLFVPMRSAAARWLGLVN